MYKTMLLCALCLSVLACAKDEKEEPAPQPVMREVRYEVLCAGSYYLEVRYNGQQGLFAQHTGDTIRTQSLPPGTWVQVWAATASAPITGRIWVDGLLRDSLSAPATWGIGLSDTIP